MRKTAKENGSKARPMAGSDGKTMTGRFAFHDLKGHTADPGRIRARSHHFSASLKSRFA